MVCYHMDMRKSISGFTIVELLIVIVVIAILAAITVVAFNGVQQRGRDSHRVSDVKQLHKALELFHAENGYYPARPEVFSATFRRDTLKIPESVVITPGTSNTIGYCWASTPNQYCYVPRPPSGGSFDCGTSGEQCIGYSISYRLENDPNTMITQRSAIWP